MWERWLSAFWLWLCPFWPVLEKYQPARSSQNMGDNGLWCLTCIPTLGRLWTPNPVLDCVQVLGMCLLSDLWIFNRNNCSRTSISYKTTFSVFIFEVSLLLIIYFVFSVCEHTHACLCAYMPSTASESRSPMCVTGRR